MMENVWQELTSLAGQRNVIVLCEKDQSTIFYRIGLAKINIEEDVTEMDEDVGCRFSKWAIWSGKLDYEIIATSRDLEKALAKAVTALTIELEVIKNTISQQRQDVKFFTETIFNRDSNRCVYCGRKATALDHIIPVSVGGQTVLNNLVASCTNCNVRKSNADWELWYKFQKFYDPAQAVYVRQIQAT